MSSNEDERTIPLYEEKLHIVKDEVVTDHLRVSTNIEERSVLIEDAVVRGNLQVERIAVERPVTQAPAPRQQGDTLIVSIVEERIVVEKRLYVIEELHITSTSTTEHVSIPETVRTMRATVKRTGATPTTGREIDG